MTFSIIQHQGDTAGKVIGTVWATDEAVARSIAPALLGSSYDGVQLQRSESREIPLKLHESLGDRFHA